MAILETLRATVLNGKVASGCEGRKDRSSCSSLPLHLRFFVMATEVQQGRHVIAPYDLTLHYFWFTSSSVLLFLYPFLSVPFKRDLVGGVHINLSLTFAVSFLLF